MNHYIILALGVVCAGLGGEAFIRGTVGLAKWLRVSAGVIGLTVTAFATSSPELSVAVSSALSGAPRIALGDALGSNVVNVALILGLALAFGSIRNGRSEVKSSYLSAVLAPIFICILAIDGRLSRIDGMLLLAAFFIWIVRVTIKAGRKRSAADKVPGKKGERSAMLFFLAGLALLIMAGRLIVSGASGIAAALGIGSFAIGAVVVAFGTSVPELATVVISRIRGHHEIGLNTILGSNIFNGLFIIGIAATICPIAFARWEVITVLAFGLATVALTLPSRSGHLERWRGAVLLALYSIFVLTAVH